MSKIETFKLWVEKHKKEATVKIRNPFDTYPDAPKHSIEMFTIIELTKIDIYKQALLFANFTEAIEVYKAFLKQSFEFYYIDSFGNMKDKIIDYSGNYVLKQIEGYKISETQKLLRYAEKLQRDEQSGYNEQQLEFNHED